MVFVVAVTQLAEALLDSPTAAGVLRYCAVFLPVAWCWVGFTFYADRFDNDDVVYRLTMFLAMLAVSLVAISVPQAFDGDAGSRRFVLSYIAVRLMLLALYARAHICAADARALTGRYLGWFALAVVVWSASLLLEPPARYAAWAIALGIELLAPIVASGAIASVPFHVSHIPERFGLFTIIVLGEAVALNAVGITTLQRGASVALVGAGGFLIVAAQWWLYFDCVDPSPMQRWRSSGQAYVYGHLVVFAALAASGVGALLATRAALGEPFDAPRRWILCGSVAAFLAAIGAIHLVHTAPYGDLRAWSRIGVAAGILVVAAVFGAATPLEIEALLLVLLCGQVVFELHRLADCDTPMLRPIAATPPAGRGRGEPR